MKMIRIGTGWVQVVRGIMRHSYEGIIFHHLKSEATMYSM